jgi:hypothetical protein
MSDKEQLHFKVTLAGTYWDKQPQYAILIDDQLMQRSFITCESGVSQIVEFDVELDEGEHELKIRLENKTNSDTVENQDKTAIVKDLLLNIQQVEIDNIDLGQMVHGKSLFTGDDPARPVLDYCIDLGWNGTWVLKFTSPFYIWLLENI